MSENRQPIRKSRSEVIEVTAVPINRPKARIKKERSPTLLWLVVVCIVLFLVWKVLALVAVAVLVLFALPRLLPGGISGFLRALLPRNRE